MVTWLEIQFANSQAYPMLILRVRDAKINNKYLKSDDGKIGINFHKQYCLGSSNASRICNKKRFSNLSVIKEYFEFYNVL